MAGQRSAWRRPPESARFCVQVRSHRWQGPRRAGNRALMLDSRHRPSASAVRSRLRRLSSAEPGGDSFAGVGDTVIALDLEPSAC